MLTPKEMRRLEKEHKTHPEEQYRSKIRADLQGPPPQEGAPVTQSTPSKGIGFLKIIGISLGAVTAILDRR
jgi:hypothetical protein